MYQHLELVVVWTVEKEHILLIQVHLFVMNVKQIQNKIMIKQDVFVQLVCNQF